MATLESQLPVIPLIIEIVESPQSIHSVEDLKFKLKVTNNGGETITLVRDPSGVLSSRYPTDKFIVNTSDGNHPHFKGVDVKWSPDKAAELGDTIVIGPGQTAHNVIDQDLSRTYDCSDTGPGLYTFTPKNTFYKVDPVSREVNLVKAASVPTVAVRIDGKLVIKDGSAPDPEPLIKFQGITFVGGTPEQHIQVVSAIRLAEDYIVNCIRCLECAKDVPTATLHYNKWFGPYDNYLTGKVKSAYSKIVDGPRRARYDLTKCADEGIYAKVNASDSNKAIHLCSWFWDAPLSGMNSQAGTIIHELTHFSDHGGAWDWVYGVANCKMLASVYWKKAVNNADSFEYFAELMGFKTASGLFFSAKDGFTGMFAIPHNPSPFIFTGSFPEAPQLFSTPGVALIYNDVTDLTGSYAIQAGSVVRSRRIILRMKNEAGKELIISGNLTPSLDDEYEAMVTGNGEWKYGDSSF